MAALNENQRKLIAVIADMSPEDVIDAWCKVGLGRRIVEMVDKNRSKLLESVGLSLWTASKLYGTMQELHRLLALLIHSEDRLKKIVELVNEDLREQQTQEDEISRLGKRLT